MVAAEGSFRPGTAQPALTAPPAYSHSPASAAEAAYPAILLFENMPFTRVLRTALLLLPVSGAASNPPPQSLPTLIEQRIQDMEGAHRAVIAGETLEYRQDLITFYRGRAFHPAWLRLGRPGPDAWQMLDAAHKSYLEGLDPDEYHASAMDSLIRTFTTRIHWRTRLEPRGAVELDLLLTDAYLKLAYDLLSGRIHPATLSDKWHIRYEQADLPERLEKALGGGVRESLHALAPPQAEYGTMKWWLAEYRAIESRGGWERIPAGPPLGKGARGPRVAALCRRLKVTRELPYGSCGDAFTPELAEAVGRFQSTHGLEPDGEAGPSTLAALNVSASARIRQIKLNLECWRWLPQDLGYRHLRINIADFSLRAMAGREEQLAMKVVVGRKQDSTPVFSDSLLAVVLNPTWNVPDDIAREEMLPELKKDAAYLDKHGMELLESWAEAARVLRADTIDWEGIDSANFHYRIREKEGGESALGKIKFVLANPFNIYLHDTPEKGYFERDIRAFSHGCVRLEKPLDLALWALKSEPDWDRGRVEAEMEKTAPVLIPLREGIAVHILYWTAFVDRQGGLQFRPDIYGWDDKLDAALQEKKRSFR
jgi:murein L,D-transpeptidase YcbB/YkuD